MAKHDPQLLRRDGLNALPVAAPDVPEKEHFFTCQQCGQRVDYRWLGDVPAIPLTVPVRQFSDAASASPLEPFNWTS